MEIITQALTSFLIVMGLVSTILLIIGFVLKAKGSTFVEFFPKKSEVVPQAPNIIYNTITNPSVSNNSYIDSRKVAAIMAAIQHHNKLKG